jgi:hypothetical protein
MNEIPFGYCHCGCGQKTKPFPYTRKNKGQVKGQPQKYLFNHDRKGVVVALRPVGPAHPNWKGDSATHTTGRDRARRWYRNAGPCVVCGNPKSGRHHKDCNPLNNAPENIEILCHLHHAKAHKEIRERLKVQA